MPGAIVPPDHEGDTVTFYISSAKSVWGTADIDWVARNRARGFEMEELITPAVRLDQVLSDLPEALYIKVDIEGADNIVLEALERTNYLPKYLSIESENREFGRLVAQVEHLTTLGYYRFAAVQQATIPGTVLSGRDLNGRSYSFRFRNHSSGPFGPFLPIGTFKSAEEVIEDYRKIFRSYRMFGAPSPLRNNRLTRFPLRLANKLLLRTIRYPLCGWHDLHAMR